MIRKTAIQSVLGCALALMCVVSTVPGVAQTAATPDIVKRGEYLARAGDCISCHTKPGGTPYAGGLRMSLPFGDLVSPNITPDVATGIGSWTASDFYRALHDGIGKSVGDLYPAMPYTFYTKITREDSDAIYAYLRSQKPVANAVDVNQLKWPFSIRWTMAFWRELYFTEGTYKPDHARAAEWNRGAYLVEGLGHCSACHSPRSILGGVEKSKAYTGASVDGWFAPNLTSASITGLGDWTVDQLASFLKKGAAKSKSTAFGDMAEVVHNSLSYLTEADIKAMAVYLKSIPPDVVAQSGATEPAPKQAAVLYLNNCSGCHQAKGRGIEGVFPPLVGNGAVIAPDPSNILKAVLGGIPAQNNYIAMPGFASSLSDQQIADIANYVRTNWGNSAPANATAKMVAGFRAPK